MRYCFTIASILFTATTLARADQPSAEAQISVLKAANAQLSAQVNSLQNQIALLQNKLAEANAALQQQNAPTPPVPIADPPATTNPVPPTKPLYTGIPHLLEKLPPALVPQNTNEWLTFTLPKFQDWVSDNGSNLALDRSFQVDVVITHLGVNMWRVSPHLHGDTFKNAVTQNAVDYSFDRINIETDDDGVHPWLKYKQGTLKRVTATVTSVEVNKAWPSVSTSLAFKYTVKLAHPKIDGF